MFLETQADGSEITKTLLSKDQLYSKRKCSILGRKGTVLSHEAILARRIVANRIFQSSTFHTVAFAQSIVTSANHETANPRRCGLIFLTRVS